MATILASIPKEANVTKIDYEGPRFALYTKTPRFLMENNTIISNLVKEIKKRIVIRIDESIRKNEDDTRKILIENVPKEANLQAISFDTASGEVSIEVKRPWLCQRNCRGAYQCGSCIMHSWQQQTVFRCRTSVLTCY